MACGNTSQALHIALEESQLNNRIGVASADTKNISYTDYRTIGFPQSSYNATNNIWNDKN